MPYQLKALEEKTNYLISHLKKVLKKLPKFIQNIVDKMFDNNYSLFSFKHDYDPDIIEERKKLRQKEQESKQQYSYDYYYEEEEELEKNNDDGMEI